MKKTFLLLAVMLMGMTFITCGDGSSDPKAPAESGQSATPTATVTEVTRDKENPDKAQFTLTSTNDGEWKVYSAAHVPLSRISVSFTAPQLTLIDPLTFPSFPSRIYPRTYSSTYYVTVTEQGKTESEPLALTIVRPTIVKGDGDEEYSYNDAGFEAMSESFTSAGILFSKISELPVWNALGFIGPLFSIVNMFTGMKSETDLKLEAIISKLNEIADAIKELNTQLNQGIVKITNTIDRTNVSNYLSNVNSAVSSALYLNGNSIGLTQARDVFSAVDANLMPPAEGWILNDPGLYHDVCQNLYSTGNSALGTSKQTVLYDSYKTLQTLITGEANQWIGNKSAAGAFETYLSIVNNYNTQTFTERQAYLDAMMNTFAVLTVYMYRAAIFDQEFNYALYTAYTNVASDTAHNTAAERASATAIAAIAWNNYLYVRDTLLDSTAKNPASITYIAQQVDISLKASQEELQKEEAAAKILPITGTTISSTGASTCTTAATTGTYAPLIYSYRLDKFLQKTLPEVKTEQWAISYPGSPNYWVESWESDKFRPATAADTAAWNAMISTADFNTLRNGAEELATNIIDDLTNARFSALKYFLARDSWATATSGYRKIYVRGLYWGPVDDTKWGTMVNSPLFSMLSNMITKSFKAPSTSSKTNPQSYIAIDYSGSETSFTIYGSCAKLFPDVAFIDPSIITYGNISNLPSTIRPAILK